MQSILNKQTPKHYKMNADRLEGVQTPAAFHYPDIHRRNHVMQRKTLVALAALLAGACALPAFAQETPAQTNLDANAAHKETRNARGNQLIDVTPEQARANELRRCDNLPPFYKDDCVARVNGQGNNQVQGSVEGGGLFVETTTSVPADELEKAQSDPSQTQVQGLPPQQTEQPVAAAHKAHKRHKKAVKKAAAAPEPAAQPQPAPAQ
jgi:hypothetical protein